MAANPEPGEKGHAAWRPLKIVCYSYARLYRQIRRMSNLGASRETSIMKGMACGEYIEQRNGGFYVAGTRLSLDSIVYSFRDGDSPISAEGKSNSGVRALT
jgi:hypothetical protein